MAYPEDLSPIEKGIIDKIITTALERGWYISIWEGEGWMIKQSRDYEAITEGVAATDITQLKFCDADKKPLGSIVLVHGNDEDVIGDCSDLPAMLELCELATPA